MPSGNREFSPIEVSGTETETRGKKCLRWRAKRHNKRVLYIGIQRWRLVVSQPIKLLGYVVNTSKILECRCGDDLTDGFPVKNAQTIQCFRAKKVCHSIDWRFAGLWSAWMVLAGATSARVFMAAPTGKLSPVGAVVVGPSTS